MWSDSENILVCVKLDPFHQFQHMLERLSDRKPWELTSLVCSSTRLDRQKSTFHCFLSQFIGLRDWQRILCWQTDSWQWEHTSTGLPWFHLKYYYHRVIPSVCWKKPSQLKHKGKNEAAAAHYMNSHISHLTQRSSGATDDKELCFMKCTGALVPLLCTLHFILLCSV